MSNTNITKRNRFLSAFTACSLAVTLCTGPLLGASAAERVSFSSESLQANAGEQIAVTVLAKDNAGIAAYGVNVSYDAECFAPVSVKNHWSTGSIQESIATSESGSFDIYWYASDNCKKNGDVFTIVFDVLTTASEGEHTISYRADALSTFAIVEDDFVSAKTTWADTVVAVTNSNPSDGTGDAIETDAPHLYAKPVHTKKKETTTIPILLENPSNLKGISLELQFDAAAVEKDSIAIAMGSELQNANQSFNVNYETGVIRYSMYADPIASDCVLLEMTLVPLKALSFEVNYIPQSTYNQDYELITLKCDPITVDFKTAETTDTTKETTTTTSKETTTTTTKKTTTTSKETTTSSTKKTTTTSKDTTTTSKATTTTSKATTTTSKATTTTSKATTTTSKATTTTSKATTTTSKDTTTTSKATTTTSKDTTTTSKETTTTSEETTTTTSKATTTTSKETTTTTSKETTTTSEETTTTTSKVTTTTSEETTTTSKVTTTTSKETTTTSKETTTTSKETTTTTSEETTTTTSEETTTTTSSEETTTTTESTTAVIGYRYNITTETNAFYYAHDENEFDAQELLSAVTRYAVYDNGLTDSVGEAVTEGITVSFDGLTPKALFEADEKGAFLYRLDVVINDAFGENRIDDGVTVYIGVKGDVNLDGSVNSIDAAKILTYSAELGAGVDASLYNSLDKMQEDFVYFLADIDGESKTQDPLSPVNAVDAASILVYAALLGSGEKLDWEEFLSA